MKYLVLLIGDGELPAWDSLTEQEQMDALQKHEAFDAACEAREGVNIVSAAALGGPSTATTLRTRSGKLAITEGPYAEAIEGLGGFYLIESPSLDVVLELLRVLPPYDMQVQPVVDPYE